MQSPPNPQQYSVFPEPILVPSNPVEQAFVDNLLGGIQLLNHVAIERIAKLLQAAKNAKEEKKLNEKGAAFAAVREVGQLAIAFGHASSDLEKRAKFAELMQNPARVAAMIEMIHRAKHIDDEEKQSMARSLREMSERYQEFGPVGLLNELELAKAARMLDSVVATIQYYLQNEKKFGDMFRVSLELYLIELNSYREYIANRMVYFLEIRQDKLQSRKEDFGFGDLCRSWMVVDEAAPSEKIAEKFDELMKPFATKKTLQAKWEEGEIDLMQSLPQNPFSSAPSENNINDYFYLYVNQFGSLDARMRLLGCGASLSADYRDAGWGAWLNWLGRGVQHAVAAVQNLPHAVLPARIKSPDAAVTKKVAVVQFTEKSKEEMLVMRNKRIFESLINIIASVSRYMRPVPEECIQDPHGELAHARNLILSIQNARWDYKGEHYADLCQGAYIRVTALIFNNMIDYMGTKRAKLFMQLLSESLSSYIDNERPSGHQSDSFDGDENLNLYYDRTGRITDGEEAVMQAVLLCVKFKDYSHYDPLVIAHFYALAAGLQQLKFKVGKSDQVLIEEVAALMLQLRECAGGKFSREIDYFLQERLGCDPKAKVERDQHSAFVKQYDAIFREFEHLYKLMGAHFPSTRVAGQRGITRRPPLFLLQIYEKKMRNELLASVVKKLLHDKAYVIPKDVMIETRNYLAAKIKANPDDFITHAKYLCFESAMASRSSRHEKELMTALHDLDKLDTDYYQHPDEDGHYFSDAGRREVTVAKIKNELALLEYLQRLLAKLPAMKDASLSDMYVSPGARLKSLQQDVSKRMVLLKGQIADLSPGTQAVTKK